MTQKEKARAYDDAIKRASKLRVQNPFDTVSQMMEYVFPELSESEDEKIRKELIEHIKANCETGFILFQKFSPDEVIDWLEKQGEKKSTELPRGEDYGIDGLWNAQRILEKTLGKVEGYQTDDGILEPECAINAVKELYEQKPTWSEEDKIRLDRICKTLWKNRKGDTDEIYQQEQDIDWLKSLKKRMGEQQ